MSARSAKKVINKGIARISDDTILRILKNKLVVNIRVKRICNDDFAIKKVRTYGTVMVDRDTSQVVDIVAFRDTKEVTEWLKGYPDIEVVSRDGSISYAKALEEAFPQVIQVSDRFRLVKNLTEEAKEYIKRTIPKRIKIAGIEEKNLPTELTEFKCTRQEMLQKRREEEKNKIVRMVKDLYRQGYLSRRISGLQKMLSGSTSDVKVE